MAFYFKAFGLNIKSEYPFRGYPSDEKGIFDVNCIKGEVPESLSEIKLKGINFESNHKQFLLKVENVANFLISEGNQVTIHPYEEVQTREIELFFLGSVMSVILMQRGIVPFHGSAIVKENKAILFSGNSGSGKSSLLSFFVNKGYKALTDDVCALNYNQDNQIIITPSYPSAKIWSDVMDKMSFEKKEEDYLRPSIEKYRKDISSSFCNEPKVVDAVYILNSHNKDNFQIREEKGITKFQALNENLYRPKYPLATGKEKETFKLINQLAQQAKVFKLTRTNNISDFDRFNQFALNQILKNA